MGGDCQKCGAIRIDQQIGLEESPDAYVGALVSVFREVRRVLRHDGVMFLNIGDSYASGGRATYRSGASDNKGQLVQNDLPRPVDAPGIKPKDLIGIPWMLAFALRSDGWYLRQDIIWQKPNPMPESVTDRCTKAHEYLFLLSKSERYFYDADAIKESAQEWSGRAATFDRSGNAVADHVIPGQAAAQHRARSDENEPRSFKGSKFNTGKTAEHQLGRASSKPRTAGNKSHKYVTEYEASDTEEHRTKAGLMKVADVPWEMRNKRSVWTVATAPYAEAHFATFPPALIDPCIKAGCPEGGTVLDCFGGAGTTGMVADRLNRNAILIELNPTYAGMAANRIRNDGGMFVDVKIETL